MEYCKNCPFYDEEYDNMRQSGDDVIFVNEEASERHYCSMYDESIDRAIIEGEKPCEYKEAALR